MAARVGREVIVSMADGRASTAFIVAGAARFDADMVGAEVRRARGRKVRSAGRILLASVLIGGGLIDGAGMSRAKQILPSLSTSLYEMPLGPGEPLTSHRHVRHTPTSP